MPTSRDIRNQVEFLTARWIELGFCDQQNPPVLRVLDHENEEISIASQGRMGMALKDVEYEQIYNELKRSRIYNMKMLDGALVQLLYRFHRRRIVKHCLAFYPSPYLDDFQNHPDIYKEDVIYAEVVKRSIVPFPFRFDFDEEAAIDLTHPRSHLTLGQYQNCRIPVSAPLTPALFLDFVLRNFYSAAHSQESQGLAVTTDRFQETITDQERTVLHMQTPIQRYSDAS